VVDGACGVLPGRQRGIAADRRRRRARGSTPSSTLFIIGAKPAGADEEGNRREIDRRPPALHDGDSGKGSRDTAIWLTVLDIARHARPSLVFFVSSDGGFASAGGRRVLRPELRSEAADGNAANLTFYFDVDQLVDRLSCPTEPPEPVETLINSAPILAAVRAHLSGGDVRTDLSSWRDELGRAFETAPDELIPLPRRDETRAARVGETTLVATNRIFHVKRRYVVPVDGGGLSGERAAEFTVLLSLLITYVDGEIERVEVLSRGGLHGQAGLQL
jgi:hypothetical protein